MIFQKYNNITRASDSFEIPFVIQTSDRSVPTIKTEFCLVERSFVDLAEQHVLAADALVLKNSYVGSPKAPLKENQLFIELRGENG